MNARHRIAAIAATAAVSAQLVACAGKPARSPPLSAPPTVGFLAPAPGSSLHGVVSITATAAGAGKISSLGFTAPPALAGARPSFDAATGAATLSADLDLSTFPDGALTITAAAKDEFGGVASKDLVVTVAKRAPSITVTRPAPSSTVKGVVTIEASAAAQAGATIASLELVDPPAGCGTAVRPDAGALAVPWDTTRTPEGPAAVHLRAVDSTGLVSDTTVLVTVDNVPLGRVEAFVSAGTPIQDATVEVWALDDATGAVSTTIGVRGLLGAGGPTDADGRAVVTLSAENYRGPISVVARPAAGATLTYLDPVPPSRTVQVPAALPLTSILPSYATGAAVTVPVTLWTTLADAEVLAYAAGAHRVAPTRHTVTEAAAFADPLFSAHLQAAAPRWLLRTTLPASLTQGPAQTLGDRAYAAFPDVALAQLARGLGAAASAPDAVTAPSLVLLLRQDLAADGQFDGKGADGAQLKTPGIPPVALDEDTLRVRLASALDDFVRSENNLSGLTRDTLAGAGVFATISGDVSALFGTKAPGAFDDQGPSAAFAVTYGPGAAAPVGNRNLVRGTVRLVVTATDPSGVRAMTLTLDGGADVPGTFAPGTAGTATLTATYDTARRGDGLATFTVAATDGRGNVRTGSYQVTIDNTPPEIAVTLPGAAAWYAGAIPLEATATDASGVTSCAETTRGAADLDSAVDHYVASWTPAAGTADGALPLSFRACDVVGNCAAQDWHAQRDTTPPTVTPGPVAPYTSAASVAITATAADAGAGIAAVYATNGSTTIAGTLSGTTWTIADVPLSEGVNNIVVWAKDRADVPNGASDHGVSVRVVRDSSRPAPYLVSGAATYASEQGIRLANASVPATYVLASTAKVDPILNQVYKVASRLGWPATDPPSAAELEGTNKYNIPFIQVAVPASASESPITSATFSLTVGGVTRTADLLPWRSPTSSDSRTVFDIPISSNFAPELATITAASFTVGVSASFTDAGGLSNSIAPQSVTFNVLGPPLFVQADGTYATLPDAMGAHRYRLADRTYHRLWDTSEVNFTNGNVRLLRYVVSNPAPYPVAVTATFGGSSDAWTARERWDWSSYRSLDEGAASASTCNGPSAPGDGALARFDVDGTQITGCEMTIAGPGTTPFCWDTTEFSHTPGYKRGPNDTVTMWGYFGVYETCRRVGRYPSTGSEETSSSSTASVELFAPGVGVQEIAPPQKTGGMAIVPAASGSAPGTLVMYVVRPVNAASADRQKALTQTWNSFAADSAYQRRTEWFLKYNGVSGGYRIGTYYNFAVQEGWANLAAARELLTGTVGLTTQGATATALTGAPSSQPGIVFSGETVATH